MEEQKQQTPTIAAWMLNYLRILQLTQQIFKTMLHQLPEHSQFFDSSSFEQLIQEQLFFTQEIMKNPYKLMELNAEFTKDYIKLYQNFFSAWLGVPNKIITMGSEDNRFKDPQWENNPVFAFIKHKYLLIGKYLSDLVYTAKDLDPDVSKKIKFYTHQLVNALSPSNFVITNPEVLRITFETAGGNLALGLEKMLNDLLEGEGRFNIKLSNTEAFVVGRDLAATPGRVVFQNRMFQLIQYEAMTDKVYKMPLLIFPPWINKYYILDLSHKNSLVRALLQEGHTVFMISWVNPDETYADTTFDDYLLEGGVKAIEVVKTITNEKKINLAAYCIGGTLVGCLLAYLAGKERDDINSVTFFATLLDFSDPGDIQVYIDKAQLKALDKRMDKKGYLDGRDMYLTFNTLRSNDLIWSYFVNNYLSGKEPFTLDLLYWNSDVTNLPALAHRFYLREFYLNNNLIKPNAITLDRVSLDLSKINIPVYAVATENDHIAPWRTVYEGLKCLSGGKRFILGGSGHIAGIINPPAKNKYSFRACDIQASSTVAENPDDWYAVASEQPGSWWPDWFKWLKNHAGKKISATEIGSKEYRPIESAPGSYVMKKVGRLHGNK